MISGIAIARFIIEIPCQNTFVAVKMLHNGFYITLQTGVFKNDFGVTPGAYQQKRRYQMAVSYLEHTRNTVRNIAMLPGFANEFHF